MATLSEVLGIAGGAAPPEEDPYRFAPTALPRELQPPPAVSAAPGIGGASLEDGLTDLNRQADLERQADELAALRREQARVLSQHGQYAQGLQQRQGQVDLQSADLELASRMAKIAAPGIPKSVSDLMLNQEARRLGVDPRGESFREFKRMFSGLDPDSRAALRSSYIRGGIETPPGQLTEMTRAAFAGTADPIAFLDMIRTSQLPLK